MSQLADARQQQPLPLQENLPRESTRRILVVDDEPDIATVLQVVLRKSGFHAVAYVNPQKALSDYKPRDYDLVLLDVRMPGMSGYEFYRELKKMDSSIKIIFLTAINVQVEIVKLFPELVAEHVMQKPVEAKVLIEAIRRRIASPSSRPNQV